VLLPAELAPRRRDEAKVLGSALVAHAKGAGHRRTALRLGLPASTVRGWLRAARANARRLCVLGTVLYYRLDANADAIKPSGAVLADAVEALGRAARAALLRLGPGPGAGPWAMANWLTSGRLLIT
jgi:hypothetical protein